MLLHVVEFLLAVFAGFNVTFYFEYHLTVVSEVSQGKKEEKEMEMEYTYSSTNFRNYPPKK